MMNYPMKAGVAKAVITPPRGVELWGFARRQGEFAATGIHDDLWVRVLILDTSRKAAPTVLINLDLGGIDGQWAKEVERIIEKETSIPSKNVIFSVTHTHAGPAPGWSRGLGKPNFEYLQTLNNAVVKTVKEASTNEVPVRGGVGVGQVDLSVNRRERPLDGPIDQDPGNVDSQVRVYRLDKQNGHPLALLVNYAAHATTLDRNNRKFSADYPGAMIRILEKNLMAQVFFCQGAAGNIEPRLKGNYHATRQLGALLAKEVMRIDKGIQTRPFSQFMSYQRSLPIYWQATPSVEGVMQELEKNQRNLEKDSKEKLSALTVSLHVLAVNETYWVTLIGEPFVELGQMVQDRFPDRTIFIIGYANDTSMGYIPTKQAYIEKGYEVDAAHYYYGKPGLPVAQETGEKLVEELTKMIEDRK